MVINKIVPEVNDFQWVKLRITYTKVISQIECQENWKFFDPKGNQVVHATLSPYPRSFNKMEIYQCEVILGYKLG